MPLLDHFHPPLAGRRHWESFHSQWASCIASFLNDHLPADYFAEAQVHAGPRIEVDVATWQESGNGGPGSVATLPRTRPQIVPADYTLPAVFPPEFGVSVYENSGGPTMVAAIELVSPGNKDRPESRQAFTAKCLAYLQRAIGLIVIDIVTNRSSEPYRDLMTQLYPQQPLTDLSALMAVSYRPTRHRDEDRLEIRQRALAIGNPLPVLPLALGGLDWLDVDLEATYEAARGQCRL